MESSDIKQLVQRMVSIEESVAHLQHDVEELNRALTGYFRRIQSFEERFIHLEHELETLGQEPEAPRNAEDEKPPHY